MQLFKKDKNKEKNTPQTPKEFQDVGTEKQPPSDSQPVLSTGYGVLKSFYVSEKASLLNSFNQYVFKVFDNTTKNEIRKQIEKSFSVKVKDVKIINLPTKTRKVGRHSGFKPGFKKAVVVLEKGYTIEQAKA